MSVNTEAALTKFVTFNDSKLASRYAKNKIPISTLFEAYFDGAVDLDVDIYDLLENRYLFTKQSFTPDHIKLFVTRVIPEIAVHSKAYDEKLVRWHYDRGDDFFSAFLGPRMVYTSAFFTNENQTLEEGQDQKLDMVCNKLGVQKGDTLLDIGCGWGTLTKHSAKNFGADATGVTISKNQTAWGNNQIKEAGVDSHARVLCLDYRDIPKNKKYKRISSLEMVEHVGVKNLTPFFKQIYNLLEDDGMFLLQWTGLRRKTCTEDLIWILFMSKYIFSGADASLPLAPMVDYMEKAGFEIHTVENISTHYQYTIKKWHDNWVGNKDAIVEAYGERWYRIWHVFLAWSVVIARQGTAACFQVVANKNLNKFDRSIYVGGRPGLSERMKLS